MTPSASWCRVLSFADSPHPQIEVLRGTASAFVRSRNTTQLRSARMLTTVFAIPRASLAARMQLLIGYSAPVTKILNGASDSHCLKAILGCSAGTYSRSRRPRHKIMRQILAPKTGRIKSLRSLQRLCSFTDAESAAQFTLLQLRLELRVRYLQRHEIWVLFRGRRIHINALGRSCSC